MWMMLMVAAAMAAGDASQGAPIYAANCQACHGARADGHGPAAAALKPPPTDFTQAAYWDGRKDSQVKAVIRSGKPGSSMMAFTQLSDAELDSVVAYLKSHKR